MGVLPNVLVNFVFLIYRAVHEMTKFQFSMVALKYYTVRISARHPVNVLLINFTCGCFSWVG